MNRNEFSNLTELFAHWSSMDRRNKQGSIRAVKAADGTIQYIIDMK
jgi:hypothetical protein